MNGVKRNCESSMTKFLGLGDEENKGTSDKEAEQRCYVDICAQAGRVRGIFMEMRGGGK